MNSNETPDYSKHENKENRRYHRENEKRDEKVYREKYMELVSKKGCCKLKKKRKSKKITRQE